MKISQQIVDGVTVFTLNGNEAIADGRTREMGSDDEIKNGLYRATCNIGKLQIWQKGELTFAAGYLEATLNFYFNSAGQLLNESQGKLVIEGKERSLDNLGTCIRK